MFIYPASVPTAARMRIDAAVARADEAFESFEQQLKVLGEFDFYLRPEDVPRVDAAAIDRLFDVVDEVIHTVSRVAQRELWTAAEFRRVVGDLIEQRINWAHAHQHSQRIDLDTFTRQVEDAVHARASWQLVAGFTTLGQQLDKLRIEARWTQKALSTVVEIDLDAVKDHLTNKRKPELSTIERYEEVFTEKLGRTVKLTD